MELVKYKMYYFVLNDIFEVEFSAFPFGELSASSFFLFINSKVIVSLKFKTVLNLKSKESSILYHWNNKNNYDCLGDFGIIQISFRSMVPHIP